jgi:cell division septum initiation protein DivIVA
MSNVNTPEAMAHSMSESLLRENKALRDEVERLKAELKDMGDQYAKDGMQLAALREYAERLREALETAQEHVAFSVGYVHESLAGYKPKVHEQADKDMAEVAAALALPKPWDAIRKSEG